MAKKSAAILPPSEPAASPAPSAAAYQSYQGLARKWRPQTFADLVGQEAVANSFVNALKEGRVVHGHILAGPRGVGKTTSARILAKALNCEQGPTPAPCGKCRHCLDIAHGNDMDVIEIDAASNTQVEKIRELLERVVLAPFSSRHKVYIIDEVHMLSISAFNALLKTLEEPPEHVIFIFATTELEKIPETVRSRCVIHNFRRLTPEDIIRRLTEVAKGEGVALEGEAAREVFALIAQSAEGGMRDALVTLDQLLAMTAGKPDADAAQRLLGLASHALLADTLGWLVDGDATKLLAAVADLVNRGRSLERFIKGLLGCLHDVMLLQAGAPAETTSVTGEALDRARALAGRLAPAQVFNMLNQLFQLEERMKRSTQVRFLIEFAFLRMAVVKPVFPIEALIDRLKSMPTAGGPAEAAPARAPEPPAAKMAMASEEERGYQAAAPVAARPAPEPPPIARLASAAFAPRPAAAFSDSAPATHAETPAAPSAPAPSFGGNPLAGLSREELIEMIVPQLPQNCQFLGRYLKGAAAMRADGDALWIQWPKADKVLSTTLARPDNRKALEHTLSEICGRPMSIRAEFATMDAATPAANPPSRPAAPARPAPLARRAAFADSAGDDPMISPPDDDEPSPAELRAAYDADRARGGSASGGDSQVSPNPTRSSGPPSWGEDSSAAPSRPPATKENTGPMILSADAARGLFESDPDLARRARMARDFFSGTFVDAAGRPLGI